MFEKNREVVKFHANGKLVCVKLNAKANTKKKTQYDPDYTVGFRVEIASFDTNTKKQDYFLYGTLMKPEEIEAFIEACDIYGKKAYQLKVQNQPKMPAVEIFGKLGGYPSDQGAVSTKFWLSTSGPNAKAKSADFFISADEAPGQQNQQGLYVRNKGVKSTRYISMGLSADAVIAIAAAMRSAKDILNMWSAFGRMDQNIYRLFPQLSQNQGAQMQPMATMPQTQVPVQPQVAQPQGQGRVQGGYQEPANGYAARQQAMRQRAQGGGYGRQGYGNGYYQ